MVDEIAVSEFLINFLNGAVVEINTDYLSFEAIEEIAFLLIPARGSA